MTSSTWDPVAEQFGALPLIFGVRIGELWALSGHLPYSERVRELHDMRIAAKRLRYCFEFFTPFFGPEADAPLKKFKQLQDFLGEIHDCDVWVDFLRDELKDAFRDLRRLHRRLARHTGAVAELREDAVALGGLVDHGPVRGLLAMLCDLVDRRSDLHARLVTFWTELEQAGFRAELTRIVAAAAAGGQAER